LTATQGELLSVAAWYDNEMGYSARLAETAAFLAKAPVAAAIGRRA
jgi:glyceraldehyde 3-phosphate dehydrogenase